MSLLDDNIIENTDMVELSNIGFPSAEDKQYLLSHYPHGFRNINNSHLKDIIAVPYINKEWFNINELTNVYPYKTCDSCILIGVKAIIYYKIYNIDYYKGRSSFPVGWSLKISPLLESDNIYWTDSFHAVINKYLYAHYQPIYNTYKETVEGAFELLDFFKMHPMSLNHIVRMALHNEKVKPWTSNQKMFNYLLNI